MFKKCSFLMILFVILFYTLDVYADEKEVLRFFEKVRAYTEISSEIKIEKYEELLLDVKAEINFLKRSKGIAQNFIIAVENTFKEYQKALACLRMGDDCEKVNNDKSVNESSEKFKKAVKDASELLDRIYNISTTTF